MWTDERNVRLDISILRSFLKTLPDHTSDTKDANVVVTRIAFQHFIIVFETNGT